MPDVSTNALSTMIIPVMLLVMQLVVGGLITWLIAIYKSGREEALERRKAQDEKIEAVKDDLQAFKARLPQEYVLRDDFIRTMAGFDAKLDRLFEMLGSHRRETHESPR